MSLTKTDVSGLYIDQTSNIVINKNENDYLQYKKMINDHKKIQSLEQKVEFFNMILNNDNLTKLQKLLEE